MLFYISYSNCLKHKNFPFYYIGSSGMVQEPESTKQLSTARLAGPSHGGIIIENFMSLAPCTTNRSAILKSGINKQAPACAKGHQKGDRIMRVVFHIDELNKWPLLLANVMNFLSAEAEATVEVVAYAEAVTYYVGDKELPEALIGKVDFVACGNALRAWEIKIDRLPGHVRVVPSGVVEIVHKQAEGYFYIRP